MFHKSDGNLRPTRGRAAGYHPNATYFSHNWTPVLIEFCTRFFVGQVFKSGRVTGIAPRHPPTPPDVRFSASGG
jgi:hypothetical protein